MPVGAPEALDERGNRGELADEQVGIDVETHLADLGRDGHDRTGRVPEAVHRRAMNLVTIH